MTPASSDAHEHDRASDSGAEAVQLQTLCAGRMPLAVASLPDASSSDAMRERLDDAGVAPLAGFFGMSLPQGAKVAFVLDDGELRLVDDGNRALLRAPREGLDSSWVAAARAHRGTMFIVLIGADLSADGGADDVGTLIERHARSGDARGAVIGFGEERPSLPLLFG
ncbi:MAG: hypothetical protein WD011_04840 [Nitriliruptoraceae bacterium]